MNKNLRPGRRAAAGLALGAALTVALPQSAALADLPGGWQALVAGGVDVDGYCSSVYGVEQPWWIRAATGVSVTAFAFVDGRGPGEGYRWQCEQLSSRVGFSDDSAEAYQQALDAWSPGEGPMPSSQNYIGDNVDASSFPLDMNDACARQYGSGSWAVLSDPNNMRAWRCYIWVAVDSSNVA